MARSGRIVGRCLVSDLCCAAFECETSAAQFEFTLGPLGHGEVVMSFATIPDAVTVLDALARAAEEDAT
ncbi:hypothetical protein [Streptomyces noursei]|uniref:hypothetical protein n=1 Tax=Streptomyces noursei TaxID=1971 RepID=UPI0019BC867F|nr:hypothetical protein [Streptomyces noursei]MCZ1014416.1 hypothetical protein [Streptomyces noursei]GGW94859.1 hypothetical protein GCM10010341_15020 [Streptomyces noursei]